MKQSYASIVTDYYNELDAVSTTVRTASGDDIEETIGATMQTPIGALSDLSEKILRRYPKVEIRRELQQLNEQLVIRNSLRTFVESEMAREMAAYFARQTSTTKCQLFSQDAGRTRKARQRADEEFDTSIGVALMMTSASGSEIEQIRRGLQDAMQLYTGLAMFHENECGPDELAIHTTAQMELPLIEATLVPYLSKFRGVVRRRVPFALDGDEMLGKQLTSAGK